ncbi:MAG: hypothetical protein Q4C17_04595 [Bacillota bacterium]|nr:hypothetical protein [Bacillota bacterium]
MFEDVAQMEKEIETFRKNVVASSELVEGIAGLTEATRQHKESYSAATTELLKKVDACIAAIKADYESALRTLSSNNDTAISNLQQNMAAEQQARMAELQQIKTALESCQAETTKKTDEQIRQLTSDCERLIAEMKTTLSAQQTAYAEKLQQTEEVIRGYQSEAEKKYNEFVNRLESTNVDQIFKEVQDLKQSIQTKFMILMGGIGATLIVAILGLILK